MSFSCRMRVFTVVCMMLFVSPAHIFASVYYVDSQNGNDQASGLSDTQAWKSLAKVSSHIFYAGDSLLLKRGSVWNQTLNLHGSGTPSNRITLDCYDQNGIIGLDGISPLPSIDCGDTTDFVVTLANESYWTISHIQISGGLRAGIRLWATTVLQMQSILLDGLKIRDTRWRENAPGAGIYCYNSGNDKRIFVDLTIRDCDVRNGQRSAIYIQSSHIYADKSDPDYYNQDVKVLSNYIRDVGGSGIVTTGCKDVLIEDNWVERCGYDNPGNSYVGIFPGSCWGGVIQHNTVCNTFGPGNDSQALDIDEGNSGVFIFQYNLTYNNYGGFFLATNNSLNSINPGVTDRCIVRYNLSIDDDINATVDNKNVCPMIVLTGQTIEFYNNTFYCNTGPLIVNKRWCNPPVFSAVFKNNIFYCPEGFYSCVSGADNSTNPCTYDSNTFYSSNDGLGVNQLLEDPLFMYPGQRSIIGAEISCQSPSINAGLPESQADLSHEDLLGNQYEIGSTHGAHQLEDAVRLEMTGSLSDSVGHQNTVSNSDASSAFVFDMDRDSDVLYLSGNGWLSIQGDLDQMDQTDVLCFEAWIKPSNSSGYRRIFDRTTSGLNDGILFDLTPSNYLRFYTQAGYLASDTAIPVAQWSHVQAVFVKNKYMMICINGTIVAICDINQDSDPWVSGMVCHFRIGADQNGSQRYIGYIDDAKIRTSYYGDDLSRTVNLGAFDINMPLEAVAYFDFEGDWDDACVYANHGIVSSSGVELRQDVVHDGYYASGFDGTGHVQIPVTEPIERVRDQLTIDCWVYVEQAIGYRRIVDKMTPGGVDGFLLDLMPDNRVRLITRGFLLTSPNPIPVQQWVRITATYRRDDSNGIHINDELVASGTVANLPVWDDTNQFSIRIGADQNGLQGFRGCIDNVILLRSND